MPVEENPNKDLIKEETVEQQSAQIEVVENTTENQNRDPEKQPNDATDKVNERVETNNEKSEDKLESTKNMGGTNEDITKGRELISPVLKKMEDLKNEMAQKFAEVAKKYETTITSGEGLSALEKLKNKRQADVEKLQAEGELNKVKTEEESKLEIERQAEVEAERLAKEQKEAQEKAEQEAKELELAKAELANLDGYKTELAGLQKEQAEINEYLATKGDPDVEAARSELEAQLASVNEKVNNLNGKIENLKDIELEVDEKEMGKDLAMIKHLEKYGEVETNPTSAQTYWTRVKRAINESSPVDQQKAKEFIDKAIAAGTLTAQYSFENIPKEIQLDKLRSELDKAGNLDPDALKSLCIEYQKTEKEIGSDSNIVPNTVRSYILEKNKEIPKEKLLGLISEFLNNDQEYIDQVVRFGIGGTETAKTENPPVEKVTENKETNNENSELNKAETEIYDKYREKWNNLLNQVSTYNDAMYYLNNPKAVQEVRNFDQNISMLENKMSPYLDNNFSYTKTYDKGEIILSSNEPNPKNNEESLAAHEISQLIQKSPELVKMFEMTSDISEKGKNLKLRDLFQQMREGSKFHLNATVESEKGEEYVKEHFTKAKQELSELESKRDKELEQVKEAEDLKVLESFTEPFGDFPNTIEISSEKEYADAAEKLKKLGYVWNGGKDLMIGNELAKPPYKLIIEDNTSGKGHGTRAKIVTYIKKGSSENY